MNTPTQNTNSLTRTNSNALSSLAAISIGLVFYTLGVAGLGIFILAVADLIPLGGMLNLSKSTGVAVIVNVGLILLFGLQHSIMARPSFKEAFSRLLPKAFERSHFVAVSGLALAFVVLAWQPLQGIVWQSQGHANTVLWAGFAFGWSYLFAATFAINHWDLFGLRQIWFYTSGKPYTPVAFKEQWMYRYSRHPIMLGVLIGTWSLPTMTATQLMMSIGMSAYIFVGLYFEERDLIKQWGQHYLGYKKRAGKLLPGL